MASVSNTAGVRTTGVSNAVRFYIYLFLIFLATCVSKPAYAFTIPVPSRASVSSNTSRLSTRLNSKSDARTRADFLRDGAAASVFSIFVSSAFGSPRAAAADSPSMDGKLRNISDEKLREIVTSDMVDRSFLVTADLTKEIYEDSSIFTDEIDAYPMEKWIKGTKKLFVAEGSRVSLVGDVVVTPKEVKFRFDEDLMFRIPLRPVVTLTGEVILTRDEGSGLIKSYREIWDQDVKSVLKTAKF